MKIGRNRVGRRTMDMVRRAALSVFLIANGFLEVIVIPPPVALASGTVATIPAVTSTTVAGTTVPAPFATVASVATAPLPPSASASTVASTTEPVRSPTVVAAISTLPAGSSLSTTAATPSVVEPSVSPTKPGDRSGTTTVTMTGTPTVPLHQWR